MSQTNTHPNNGLSYPPYKQVVVIKLLNTYTNNEVHDPNGSKEQVKVKYEATKAIVRRFPNGTDTLMHLLSNAELALDWDGYCALPATHMGKKSRRTNSRNDFYNELKE